MAEKPEDLNLPNAVVARIIKEALPNGVIVAKDARLAISKAASVFVLYATSCANNNALAAKRKTINGNDVFSAIEDMEFDKFIEPLKEALDNYKKGQATKKSKKVGKSGKPKDSDSLEVNENDPGNVDSQNEEEDAGNLSHEVDHEHTHDIPS